MGLSEKAKQELLAQLEVAKFKSDDTANKIKTLFELSSTVDSQNSANFLKFESRIKKLENQYEEFSQHIADIVKISSLAEVIFDTEQLQALSNEIDEQYFSICSVMSKLNLHQEISNRSLTDSTTVNHPTLNLPRINLPVFDGTLNNWNSFKDTYLSLIHNQESLSNVQKFHYLLSSLKNEALSLAKTLPVTDDNYPIIWKKMLDRFDNKRILATYYLDQICNLSVMHTENPKALRQIIDCIVENKSALERIKPTHLDNFFFFNMTLKLLDKRTRQRFEETCATEIPTFEELIDFLNKHCNALDMSQNQSAPLPSSNKLGERSGPKAWQPSNINFNRHRSDAPRKALLSACTPTKPTCLHCSGEHSIYKCPTFAKLTSGQRRDFIKSKNACFNCLSDQHMRNVCTSKSTCRICSSNHHTLVHDDKPSENQGFQPAPNPTPATVCTSLQQPSVPSESTHVLLGTVRMLIEDSSGNLQTARGLLDCGSQVSCITEECFKRLGLPRTKYHIPIVGLSQTPVFKPKGMVNCNLKPSTDENINLNVNAVILHKITSSLPSNKLSKSVRDHYKHLTLADNFFDTPSPVDILLGADVFASVFDGERVNAPPGLPTPFHSIFGWILLGSVNQKYFEDFPKQETLTSNVCVIQSSSSLDTSLKKFWEIEEVPSTKPIVSIEDQHCESYFQHNHSRDETGRYIVKLPFKEDPPVLGDSFSTALRRFHSLERKLERSPDLKTTYHSFMAEYETLGHMKLLLEHETNCKYFIPHHGILKLDGEKPKFRTVFDGSAKTSNGVSLNDKLFAGPKLQRDITEIICRFRLHRIVFTSDICKMYRQILVHHDHQPYQVILWRSSADEPVRKYALQTVTYGLTCSPFLAMRTLLQLVSDEGSAYPNASRVVSKDMFVDDIVTGSSNVESALALKTELTDMFSNAGLELRKWSSNSSEFLSNIPNEHQDNPLSFDSESLSVKKILGLKWEPSSDEFGYDVTAVNSPPTKRNILSQVARIFDPLGWLSPTVLWAKNLIQLLWTEGIDWDDLSSTDVQEKWFKFVEQLPNLKEIFIPRLVLPERFIDLQLHGFSDASERGYAGVVYLRVTCEDQTISTHLIIAKSRVSPLKSISIPRLELCGAQLLTHLLHFCETSLLEHSKEFNLTTFAWTDSTVVLNWLHTSPHLLKTFVANRVSLIQDKLNPSQWHYTPGECNPADCASRGILPSELVAHPLWWHGPPWLLRDAEHWPEQSYPINPQNILEAKARTCNVTTKPLDFDLSFLETFSSLTRLQRTTAWILRFINNARQHNQSFGLISVSELNNALTLWVKQTQLYYFTEDVVSLQVTGTARSQPLLRLDPFLDSSGVIRVGGRIRNSSLEYQSKHPILLPKSCHLTSLIIDSYHVTHLHGGPKLLQAMILQRFWICSARNAIRSRLSKCVKCVRFRASLPQPFMGDLPARRIQQSRPFLSCGVDFAGPYLQRASKLRKSQVLKSYLCIFVCFATKAVHLEAVSSLSAEDFLAAFTRFISRRGICKDVYSDLGTNFVAASKELKELRQLFDANTSELIQKTLSEKNIAWHFNPPSAPHFGGLWEAAVKSAKFHLRRVIGEQVLTFEELTTLFTQVEAVLNSRPLCAISSDPNNVEVLTPSHFLIGDILTAVPNPDMTEIHLNRLSRWQLIQQASQHFWRKWSQEYLHTLQQRGKWTRHNANLKIGDLVLIRDSNVPPLRWPTARVTAVHPGEDSTVRVVTLKTASGQLTRPVVKLCPLPIT